VQPDDDDARYRLSSLKGTHRTTKIAPLQGAKQGNACLVGFHSVFSLHPTLLNLSPSGKTLTGFPGILNINEGFRPAYVKNNKSPPNCTFQIIRIIQIIPRVPFGVSTAVAGLYTSTRWAAGGFGVGPGIFENVEMDVGGLRPLSGLSGAGFAGWER